MSARRVGWLVATLGALLVAALTLVPGGGAARLPIACLWCDSYALQDALLNVLLFVPLGIGLGLAGPRAATAAGIALLVSASVEAAQLSLVAGRDPSLRDLLTNLLGALLGFVAGRGWKRVLFPHKRVAWRQAGWARLVWVAMNVAGGWLLVPSLPERPSAVIAGTHVGGFADFGGRVLRSGVATSPGAVASVVIEPGPRSDALTPVLTVVVGGHFPLMLAIEGDDVVLRVRTRAESIRLRSPSMRFPDEIKPWYRTMPPPRNLLNVVAVRTAERGTAAVQASSGALLRAEVPVRSTQVWALLRPGGHAFGVGRDIPSAVWCALLLLPVGYWTARTGRHRRRLGWSLAVVAAASGFVVAPLFFSQAWPGIWEAGGALLGLLAGGAPGHLSRSILYRPHTSHDLSR